MEFKVHLSNYWKTCLWEFPAGVLPSRLRVPLLQFLRPSGTCQSWRVTYKNHILIVESVTPAVGMSAVVQTPSSAFESTCKTRLSAAADNQQYFPRLHFVQTTCYNFKQWTAIGHLFVHLDPTSPWLRLLHQCIVPPCPLALFYHYPPTLYITSSVTSATKIYFISLVLLKARI
jgi:hypothetical protein